MRFLSVPLASRSASLRCLAPGLTILVALGCGGRSPTAPTQGGDVNPFTASVYQRPATGIRVDIMNVLNANENFTDQEIALLRSGLDSLSESEALTFRIIEPYFYPQAETTWRCSTFLMVRGSPTSTTLAVLFAKPRASRTPDPALATELIAVARSSVVNGFSESAERCRQRPSPVATNPPPNPSPTQPSTDPPWLQALASDYPASHAVSNVRVFADQGLGGGFAVTHADHLKRVWDYFNGLYRQNRGPRLDVYYTRNAAVFQKVVPHCPTTFIPGARNLTACYLDYPRWFIMPYQVPDFGTQLHEIGHDFLYATWPGSEDSTWYKEGTAMYYEGGTFRADGSLVVTAPWSYCTTFFRRDSPNRIHPLNTLIRMSKSAFLADSERTYSQSCMFFNYLQTREPRVLPGLIDGINTGRIRSNDQLIEQMLSIAGKSLAELEGGYLTYARQVS